MVFLFYNKKKYIKIIELVSFISSFLIFLPLSLAQVSLPQTFTIEGRFFLDNSPVDESVDVVLEIYPQGYSSCILYRENHTVDVSSSDVNSKGAFALVVGSGNSQELWATSFEKIFSNNQNIPGDGCTMSASQLTGKTRLIRMQIKRSLDSGSYVTLSPDTSITAVPTAMVADSAETLQGLEPNDVFQTNTGGGVTQAKLDDLLANYYTSITSLASGSSTLYLQNSVTTGTTIPNISGDPGSLSAGQMWFDSNAGELKYSDGTNIKVVDVAGTGIQTVTAGTGVTVTTSGTDATVSLPSVGTADTYYKVTTDAQGRVMSGQTTLSVSDIPSLDAAKITTGTFSAGLIPTNTDTTKLPLAGGTMTGQITMGSATDFASFDLLATGHLTMSAQRTLRFGTFDDTQQASLVPLAANQAGTTWYNSTNNKLMY
ncbi:MAG: hypothetical protein H6623_01415 [Bdellovibrionaceae bacterium]|nr:hypothetical protein [Pseudobdellovibrionaceae bacterium]